MAQIYDETDLEFTWRGDFLLEGGDLKDTSDDPLRYLIQEISSIVKSQAGDWKSWEDYGASLNDFIGESNNPITAQGIEQRILDAATRYRTVGDEDITVEVIPYDYDKVAILISIEVIRTAENNLPGRIDIVFDFSYSLEVGIAYREAEIRGYI